MKMISVAAIVALAVALGGCFQGVLSNYETQYPNDPTAKPCKVPADCTANGGGGGGGD
jgi:hypothetical protein